jgi:hypothetical protein
MVHVRFLIQPAREIIKMMHTSNSLFLPINPTIVPGPWVGLLVNM